jgi:Asp-tRNA(Asn)/Glu-tRNA(Gln) amidotransferase A subunit family amidase
VSANAGARALAGAVRKGERSAVEVIRETLAAIAARNGAINAFTAVTERRVLADAAAVDTARQRGRDPGPLACRSPSRISTTLRGSQRSPARASIATAYRQRMMPARRLAGAGAVLVGALNMDEYAFGFSTENTHYGATRNPHDPERIAGGSSGGSAAAVAAFLVPLALGPTPTDRYACLRRCVACLGCDRPTAG